VIVFVGPTSRAGPGSKFAVICRRMGVTTNGTELNGKTQLNIPICLSHRSQPHIVKVTYQTMDTGLGVKSKSECKYKIACVVFCNLVEYTSAANRNC